MPTSRSPSPAVVFIHGIGGSARVWAPQVASFAAAGFAPVALDLPGYGGRPPVEAMDFEGLAADVEAAIDKRGLNGPVLVGHSMGGMVAQTALRRRPHGYSAAVLVCTSPAFGSADGAFQTKFVADRLGPLDAGKTMADLAPKMVDRMIGPSADPAGRAHAVEVMSAVPAETYRAAVRCLVGFDERANLGEDCRSRALPCRREGPQRSGCGRRAHGGQDSRRALCLSPRRGTLAQSRGRRLHSTLLLSASCATRFLPPRPDRLPR